MANLNVQGPGIRLAYKGLKVDRAAALLPATATGALFNVKGGRVVLTGIVGEVVVVLPGTATNAKLLSTPTVGTAVDLCAAAAITSKQAGCLLSISGTAADALVQSNAGAAAGMGRDVILPIGALGINTDATMATGTVKWTVTYVPLDDGAYMEAA